MTVSASTPISEIRQNVHHFSEFPRENRPIFEFRPFRKNPSPHGRTSIFSRHLEVHNWIHTIEYMLHFFFLAFETVEQMAYAVKRDKSIKGGLLDSYVARYRQDQFLEYRIQRVIDEVAAYGIVLRSRVVHLRQCMDEYVKNNQFQIYSDIQNSIPALQVTFFWY